MGKNKDITQTECKKIYRMSTRRMSAVEIGKKIERDTRTIKKVLNDYDSGRKSRSDKGKFCLSARDKRKLKHTGRKFPLETSKSVFQKAGLPNF